jgi:tRNA pseudouridine synthase 10
MARTRGGFETTQAMCRNAAAIRDAGPICDDCLGRAFGMVGHGLSNRERGDILRRSCGLPGSASADSCWVCGGVFSGIERWAARAVERSRGYQFERYLFGVRLTPRLETMEALFAERFPTGQAEPLKRSLNRQLGKAFEALGGGGTVSFDHPDLTFGVDLASETVSMRVASLYLYGRYRKLQRGIPQTHWPCRTCRGRGCPACSGTGKQYPESVEELVASAAIEAAEATGAHLHGSGREDIDARMLGTGRPFVLELLAPRRRRLDLPALTARINAEARGKVEISTLELTTRSRVAEIKEARARKRYRARVGFAAPVPEETLQEAVRRLIGPIEQRTPCRVAHRRADRVRVREVHEATARWIAPQAAEIELQTEAGLYVKELISGDSGRTDPSLAALLETAASVEALDVLDVALPPEPPLGKPRKVS